MAGPLTEVQTMRFIATPGAVSSAFRRGLDKWLNQPFEFQLNADLSGVLLEHMLANYQLAPQNQALSPVIVVDPESVKQWCSNDIPGVVSIMCGDSNQHALKAFNAGIRLFFCLSADFRVQQRQIEQLLVSYQRELDAHRWRVASASLASQYECSPAGLMHKLNELKSSYGRPAQHIALRCGVDWQYVDWQTIRYVEAAGDYMCVYTLEETLIVRSTLTELAQRLPKDSFTRVNRSIIVNTQYVKRLIKLNSRVNYVELSDGSKVKISRRLMPLCHRQLHAAALQS